jgi:hypothetical protein
MKVCKFLRDDIAQAIAGVDGDSEIAIPTDPPVVKLVAKDFDEEDIDVLADLPEGFLPATTGLITGISAVGGEQLESVDPDNGNPLIQLKSPVGGFRFETTAIPTAPDVVRGYVVLNAGATEILLVNKFENPVTFDDINQAFTIGEIVFPVKFA